MDTFVEILQQAEAPPPEFWDNELEMGIQHILPALTSEESSQEWIEKLNGRQLETLCDCLGLVVRNRIKDRREALQSLNGQLLPYRLVDCFSMRKSKVAIVELSQDILDKAIVEGCRINDEDFDTKALLFALYHYNHQELRNVFLLDKIQKTGFARMALAVPPTGKPDASFQDFLSPDRIRRMLETYDCDKKDRRTSDFKALLMEEGRPILFIRRAEKPSLIVQTVGVLHGFHPEWIILDFSPDAKRVRISSSSRTVPLEIANRLASGYFQAECEYENEIEDVFEQQIHHLFGLLMKGQASQLSFVEILLQHSPLDGASKVNLSDPVSICKSVVHFQHAVGDILSDLLNIKSIKVLYKGKRVRLIFESVDGARDRFDFRYTDQPLNARERTTFEELMRSEHGIPVLSTEKRHKH
ncbi:MAG: hypothetical protein HQL64_15695 [Magnetococcales bacterium]|nr:hypothetical protein [Magnetococcales bacterium]